MDKVNSHVAIPKFLLNNFTYDGKHAFVFDYMKKNIYKSNTQKIGVKNGHYSQEIEKRLNWFESEFKNIVSEIQRKISEVCADEVVDFLNSNINKTLDFANFAIIRCNFVFEYFQDDINENLKKNNISFSSPSDVMTFCLDKNLNLINNFGDNISLIINDSTKDIITNSLGFHFIVNKNKNKKMFIPISGKLGIVISNESIIYNVDDNMLEELNKNCIEFDRSFGYGFVISNLKENLE